MIDLKFKYGTGNLPDKNAGAVYIKKIEKPGRAKLYIDTPIEAAGSVERLVIGGDVYVGDQNDSEASSYDVVINPNGNVIENFVTSEIDGGFIIKVETSNDPNSYIPSTSELTKNTIILVLDENNL